MATQIVPHPIPIPQVGESTATEISQAQLKRLIFLRNSLSTLKAELESAEGEIKQQLESGAAIEPGLHTANLKESLRRSVPWRDVAERLADRLYGDGRGEAYCENVLQNTKPTRTVALTVN